MAVATRRNVLLAGTGALFLITAAVIPTTQTDAAWSSSADRTQSALGMETYTNVTFADQLGPLRPSARVGVSTGSTVTPKNNGFALQPGSFFMSPLTSSWIARLLDAGGNKTSMVWGRGGDCAAASLPVGGNRSAISTGSASDNLPYWRGAVSSYSSSSPATTGAPDAYAVSPGTTLAPCLRLDQGSWTDTKRIASNGGEVYRISTNFSVLQPGAGTFFVKGPDLTTATSHPAPSTPGVWSTTYAIPLPGVQLDPSKSCKQDGDTSGNLDLFWGWPTLGVEYTRYTSNSSIPVVDTQTLENGRIRTYVRPAESTDYVADPWKLMDDGDKVGEVRGNYQLGQDIANDSGYPGRTGWFHLAWVVYPFADVSNVNDLQHYTVSSKVMQVYVSAWDKAWCGNYLGKPWGTRELLVDNPTPSGHPMAPGAHGYTDAQGRDINAYMSTGPTS